MSLSRPTGDDRSAAERRQDVARAMLENIHDAWSKLSSAQGRAYELLGVEHRTHRALSAVRELLELLQVDAAQVLDLPTIEPEDC